MPRIIEIYILAIQLSTFNFERLINVITSPSGSENISVSTNIPSDASIPDKSCLNISSILSKNPVFSLTVSSAFITESVPGCPRHADSSSPHF